MSELRQRVLEVYAEAEREVAAAGPTCFASGRCCRFKEWGHVLYLSNLEAQLLLEGAAAYPTPVGADTCPHQRDNLCTARDVRPLGCRIYFCDPAYQEQSHAITERALARLKALAVEYTVEWRYAPLHHFLNHPTDACVEPQVKP